MSPFLTEPEVRECLERILREAEEPYTWWTREVELELRAGGSISGELQHLEPASAIVAGPRGLEAVPTRSIGNVLVTLRSPGPE